MCQIVMMMLVVMLMRVIVIMVVFDRICNQAVKTRLIMVMVV